MTSPDLPFRESDNLTRSIADALCEMCGNQAYYVLGTEDPVDFCADCAVSVLLNADAEAVSERDRYREVLEHFCDHPQIPMPARAIAQRALEGK